MYYNFKELTLIKLCINSCFSEVYNIQGEHLLGELKNNPHTDYVI